MQNNVALFGGAFDPFHNGHQYIINQLKLLNFTKIILVPTGVSAFNKNLTEAKHRINMINAATNDVEVSDYEVNQSDQITFSIDTIKFYLKTYPHLTLVIGEDCFYTFDRWKDWKKIIELVKIIVIKRKSDIDDFLWIAKTKKIDVVKNFKKFQSQKNNCLYYHDGDGYDASSSEIKKLIKNQHIEDVQNLISYDVLHYITKYKLYI
jgi:nicotinate-nucleotide adenylyltransferase